MFRRPRQVKLLAVLYSVLMLHTSAAAEAPAPKPAPAPAPAPDWKAFFQMHYANRIQSFREQNLMLQNVVLVGDSITEGFDITKYFPGRRVLNRGIGADVIGNALPDSDKRGVLKRLDESFFRCSATDAFLLIGINDLGDNHTPDVMEAGYRDILKHVKTQAPAIQVHVQSLLPTRGNYAKHNPNIIDFNARLQKMAKEFDYDYIDLHTPMADDKGELKQEFTADGLHINAAGYKVWKSKIEETLGW